MRRGEDEGREVERRTERHFDALLCVEMDGGELVVLNLLQGDCGDQRKKKNLAVREKGGDATRSGPTLIDDDELYDSKSGVGSHLNGSKSTAWKAFVTKDRGSVEGRIVAWRERDEKKRSTLRAEGRGGCEETETDQGYLRRGTSGRGINKTKKESQRHASRP